MTYSRGRAAGVSYGPEPLGYSLNRHHGIDLRFVTLLRYSLAFGQTVTESGPFKVCLRQRDRILRVRYPFLRPLQPVQRPRLNCYFASDNSVKSACNMGIPVL